MVFHGLSIIKDEQAQWRQNHAAMIKPAEYSLPVSEFNDRYVQIAFQVNANMYMHGHFNFAGISLQMPRLYRFFNVHVIMINSVSILHM